ncbi:hypothetical protein C8R41DRAFT_917679 [Lentinula lateritia]|uniref:Uncharacterized protein n=1 Tax=Lentinula lateritia TaxID=40482 RepID=A0ABQ8VLR6_9AGAR|nr:hypothetical protein C8R41DRAFT_917679 [Lentinula lateritia]
MNHKKLNRLAKRHYRPSSGSDDDDYKPSESQQLSLVAKKHRPAESLPTHINGSPLPPRSSFLAAMDANQDLADSHVFDDDVGSQQFIDNLLATNGLDSSLNSEEMEDYNSDIDNVEYNLESQKPDLYGSSPAPSSPGKPLSTYYQIVTEEYGVTEIADLGQETSAFCPHSASACACADFLLTQYHQLNKCLAQERHENEQLIAQNFRQNIRLKHVAHLLGKSLGSFGRSHDAEPNTLSIMKKEAEAALVAARKDAEEARAAQKTAEGLLQLANNMRLEILALVQDHL